MATDQSISDGGVDHAMLFASWLSTDAEDGHHGRSLVITVAAVVALVASLVGGLAFLEHWIAHWDNR